MSLIELSWTAKKVQNTFFNTLEPLWKSALHHTRISPTVAIESYLLPLEHNVHWILSVQEVLNPKRSTPGPIRNGQKRKQFKDLVGRPKSQRTRNLKKSNGQNKPRIIILVMTVMYHLWDSRLLRLNNWGFFVFDFVNHRLADERKKDQLSNFMQTIPQLNSNSNYVQKAVSTNMTVRLIAM